MNGRSYLGIHLPDWYCTFVHLRPLYSEHELPSILLTMATQITIMDESSKGIDLRRIVCFQKEKTDRKKQGIKYFDAPIRDLCTGLIKPPDIKLKPPANGSKLPIELIVHTSPTIQTSTLIW